jgi:hypothetical protein
MRRCRQRELSFYPRFGKRIVRRDNRFANFAQGARDAAAPFSRLFMFFFRSNYPLFQGGQTKMVFNANENGASPFRPYFGPQDHVELPKSMGDTRRRMVYPAARCQGSAPRQHC